MYVCVCSVLCCSLQFWIRLAPLKFLVVVSADCQIRDARLKKDNGLKCRQGGAADKAVNGSDHDLKSDAEKKTKTVDGSETNRKLSQAAKTDSPAHKAEPMSSELASETMWEDISDVSETSGISSSYSDLSAEPATTRVTVVGNGLIQVSPADPLIRRFALGPDESKMSAGLNWKSSDDLNKHRYLWNTCGDVVTEQEWEQSAEDTSVSLTDVDGHPHRLVQLQNILPLFIFGMNKEGSRSIRLAVIGNHEINSEYLLSRGRSDSEMVSGTDNMPMNNHLLTKSTTGQVSELTDVILSNGTRLSFTLVFSRQIFVI